MRMRHEWNVGLVAVALLVGAASLSVATKRPRAEPPVAEELSLPVPVEHWPADAGATPVHGPLGLLPEVPGQKVGRCDPDLGEVELQGRCWMKTDVPPPCPKGKLYPHEGKCWRPIPKTARAPTSGGRSPGGVADP